MSTLTSQIRSAALYAAVGLNLTAAACDVAPQARQTQQPAAAPRAAVYPELVPVPADVPSIQDYVALELTRSQREQRPLLVYAGAAWCEPCRRFHEALETGALNDVLPPIRFLELDYDTQREALASAGYTTKLLPLFGVPNADGSGSSRKMEGSIKGETAVQANLVPRLKALLQPAPAP